MIKLKNVSVAYGDELIINDLDFQIGEGLLNVIIGKNGCGKTTLLKAITNQVKYKGVITVNDYNIRTMTNKQRGRTISYLPQITNSASISVNKLVQHGRYPYTTHNRTLLNSDVDKIESALKFADVIHLRNKYVNQLSGGERQRAFLAMILAQDADVVVLDEPCSFLDIDHQLSILEIICNLKKLGKTIVLVLHDLQQAFTVADRIILMDKGQIVINDTPSNVVKCEEIKSIFSIEIESCDNGIYDYCLKEV